MNKIIYLLLFIAILIPVVNAQNFTKNTTYELYFCDLTPDGLNCVPYKNETIQKNDIANGLTNNYSMAINFLEAGQNSTYINQTISDMQLIERTNPGFNASGWNQMVWASHRQAEALEWLYSKIGMLMWVIEQLYKFDRFIFEFRL